MTKTARTLLMLLSPNPTGAVLLLGGATLQALLLLLAPHSPYAIEGAHRFSVLLVLFCSWTALVWLLYGLAKLAQLSGPRLAALRYSAVALAAALGLFILSSWTFRLSSSRFLNLETATFGLANIHLLWLHLSRTQPLDLGGLALFAVLFIAFLPKLLRRLAGDTWAPPGLADPRWHRGLSHGGILLALVFVNDAAVQQADTALRTGLRNQCLKTQVDPLLSLASGAVELFLEPPILPVLDEADLVPIASPVPPAAAERPSIVFITVESLRADVVGLRHQGREVAPAINALAARGVHFTRAYVQSSHSDYSYVSLDSSLYPLWGTTHRYYRRADPWPKRLLWDVLKDAGYSTSFISSQNEQWSAMDQFSRTPGLDYFFDASTSGLIGRPQPGDDGFAREIASGILGSWNIDDDITIDTAIARLRRVASGPGPFHLRLNLQSAHFPYELRAERPRPFQPCTIDFPVSFMWYPPGKAEILRNAYLNAVAEADRQIGRLVEELKALGRFESSIIVVCGDHGEAFHENGIINHAGLPMEPALRTAAILVAPGLAPRREDYPLELVDLVPTLMSLAGLPPHAGHQGIDILSAARPPLEERLVFSHVEVSNARADCVILAGRWKYLIDRAARVELLFDLQEDPREERNIAGTRPDLAPLRSLLIAWRQRQLAYYCYPFYYQRYYPPRAPRWPPAGGGTEGSRK